MEKRKVRKMQTNSPYGDLGDGFPESPTREIIEPSNLPSSTPLEVYRKLLEKISVTKISEGWSNAIVCANFETDGIPYSGDGDGHIADTLRRMGFLFNIEENHKRITDSHSPLGRYKEQCLYALKKYAEGKLSSNETCAACITFIVRGVRQSRKFRAGIENTTRNEDEQLALEYVLRSMEETHYRDIINSFPPEITQAIRDAVLGKNPRLTEETPDLKDMGIYV